MDCVGASVLLGTYADYALARLVRPSVGCVGTALCAAVVVGWASWPGRPGRCSSCLL